MNTQKKSNQGIPQWKLKQIEEARKILEAKVLKRDTTVKIPVPTLKEIKNTSIGK